MKMRKAALPSLRDKGTFEMNEKLEGDLLNWNLNPDDFDGKAHLVREASAKAKRKVRL